MAATSSPLADLTPEAGARLQQFLDLTDPDCLLLLERTSLGTLDLSRPLAEYRRKEFAGTLGLFERWLAAEGRPTLSSLTDSELISATELWLLWLTKPTTADHPAVWPPADPTVKSKTGYRTTLAPLKSLDRPRAALNWWAESNGRPSPVSERARLLKSPLSNEPPKRARALSNDDLAAAVEAYSSLSVHAIRDEDRSRLYHAREKAAFLVSVFASLRISERGLLLDDHIVAIDEDSVSIRMLRTKFYPEGRIVRLTARPDILCPLTALTDFLVLCANAGLHRGGFLLPLVRQRGVPLVVRNTSLEMRNWNRLTSSVGWDSHPEVLEGTFTATSHGQRATLLTRAVAANWDPANLLRLGGWKSAKTALGYDRNHGLDWDLAEAAGL